LNFWQNLFNSLNHLAAAHRSQIVFALNYVLVSLAQMFVCAAKCSTIVAWKHDLDNKTLVSLYGGGDLQPRIPRNRNPYRAASNIGQKAFLTCHSWPHLNIKYRFFAVSPPFNGLERGIAQLAQHVQLNLIVVADD